MQIRNDPEDEDGERPLAQQLQRVEADDVGPGRALAGAFSSGGVCGSARQNRPSRIEAPAGDPQRRRRRLEAERADGQPGDDPADRPEHADRRELAAGIDHLAERQRVAQRERRHVAQRVDQQHAVEPAEGRLRRRKEEDDAADNVERGEDALGRHEPIRDHADEERRDHRRQRRRAGGQADLLAREVQRLAEPRPHRHVPRAPHEVLQEHHRGQLYAHA